MDTRLQKVGPGIPGLMTGHPVFGFEAFILGLQGFIITEKIVALANDDDQADMLSALCRPGSAIGVVVVIHSWCSKESFAHIFQI